MSDKGYTFSQLDVWGWTGTSTNAKLLGMQLTFSPDSGIGPPLVSPLFGGALGN